MVDAIRNAESFLGARGHLAAVVQPVRTAEANRQGKRNAFMNSLEFKLASPQKQQEVLAEQDQREWFVPVAEAEKGAAETLQNAADWIPELETFAKSEPLPSEKDLQRARLLRPIVDEDVAELRLPSQVAFLLDVARIEGDVGRLYATVRSVRKRQQDPANGKQGFTSPELKAALEKAVYVLTQPGAKDRERAKALVDELKAAIAKTRAAVAEVRKQETDEQAKAAMRASGMYSGF